MDLWPQAIGELVGLVAAKKLTWRETIHDGLENAPQALVDLLRGGRTSARCWSRSIEPSEPHASRAPFVSPACK